MNLYKYETHTHTTEASKCSNTNASELVQFYKKKGYAGVFITDHFLNGNTSVPKEFPWEKSIELFCRGFEEAYKEGKRIGIQVFFGWECSFSGTDILTYGLDKDWLLNNPDLHKLNINEYCDFISEAGGFLVHAHPFREADYIDLIRLVPRKVDAVETLNANRTEFENRLADEYAENYKIIKFAGSDNHSVCQNKLCGIQSKKKVETVEEMIELTKNGQIELFVDNEKSGK